MGSNDRFFEAVPRSHKFSLLIFYQNEVIHVYRWTKTYALGSAYKHAVDRGKEIKNDPSETQAYEYEQLIMSTFMS